MSKVLHVFVAIVLLVGSIALTFFLTKRANDRKIVALTELLASSQKTQQVDRSLYAVKLLEIEGLTEIIKANRTENESLSKALDGSKAEILSYQRIALRWKSSYEGVLESRQEDAPPVLEGDTPRKKVTFEGSLGNVSVSGFTLTDPPAAHMKISQLKPIVLTVSVTEKPDGSFGSYVETSEPDMDVQVQLGAIDLKVVESRWFERISIVGGAHVLGDIGGSLGVSYDVGRLSYGVSCSLFVDRNGCGASIGFRPFSR